MIARDRKPRASCSPARYSEGFSNYLSQQVAFRKSAFLRLLIAAVSHEVIRDAALVDQSKETVP
jgi:hypothetical protein